MNGDRYVILGGGNWSCVLRCIGIITEGVNDSLRKYSVGGRTVRSSYGSPSSEYDVIFARSIVDLHDVLVGSEDRSRCRRND